MNDRVLCDRHFEDNKDTGYFDVSQMFPISQSACNFDGHLFDCPKNVTYALEIMYGQDWMTPKQGFITADLVKT